MPSLNIPLNSNKTARQPRRAVWGLLVISLFVGILFIQAWFTRDTLAAYAPENTAITIRLTPTKQTWPILLDKFSNLSLIKDRGLTLNMIAPYIQGEVSVFINRDHSRVLAFHGQIPEETESTLTKSGYFVEIDSNTVIISKNAYTLNNQSKKIPFLSRMSPNTLGHILLNTDEQTVFKLNLSESDIQINTGDITETTEVNLTNELIMAASIPAGNWISYFQEHTSEQAVKHLSEHGGQILIRQDLDNNLFIELIINKTFTENELVELHNQILTLNKPEVTTKILSDGTKLHELQSKHGAERTSLSKLGSMISIDSNNLSSTTNESTTTITYKTVGLDYQKPSELPKACIDNPVGYLHPLSFLSFLQTNSVVYKNNNELIRLLSNFVYISLDKQEKKNTVCAFF